MRITAILGNYLSDMLGKLSEEINTPVLARLPIMPALANAADNGIKAADDVDINLGPVLEA